MEMIRWASVASGASFTNWEIFNWRLFCFKILISHVSITMLIVSADPDSLWKPHQWEYVQQIYNLSPAALNTTGISNTHKENRSILLIE